MRRTLLAPILTALALLFGCSGGNSDDGGTDFRMLDQVSTEVAETRTLPDTPAPTDLPTTETPQAEVVPEVPCVPDCEDKECGDDGCGGQCGVCSGAQEKCKEGTCVCTPTCTGKECGDDGCGGSCGECVAPEECVVNTCECQPDCEGKECGSDGCLGQCGFCGENLACQDFACVCAYGACAPGDDLDTVCNVEPLADCEVWECGEDGCCAKGTIPAPECCTKAEDCRDCINLETADMQPCPYTIPDGYVTNKCTMDSCGLNNECKHFDKVLFGECNDDNDCTKDGCMPESGVCTHDPIPDCP